MVNSKLGGRKEKFVKFISHERGTKKKYREQEWRLWPTRG